jgi:hypothetical protein
MPATTKRVTRVLTEQDLNQLKNEGVLSLGDKLPQIESDLSFDKVTEINYVLNATDAIVSIGDLKTFDGSEGLTIQPRNLVFLPHYATQENLKRSTGLRNLISRSKSLKLVVDPLKELTVADVTPNPTMEETLAPGEHLDDSDNPFDDVLDEIDRKEAAFDARITGRGRQPRRQRAKKQ